MTARRMTVATMKPVPLEREGVTGFMLGFIGASMVVR
jgi:hypothetical protein